MNSRFNPIALTIIAVLLFVFSQNDARAQRGSAALYWAKDGYQYYTTQNGEIIELDTRDPAQKTVLVTAAMLTPPGKKPLTVRRFTITDDGKKILINTNTKRVWRQDSRGDYWIYDTEAKTLKQIGVGKPESSLMFAKLSPDGTKAAYVSLHNIYVEDLKSGVIMPLTKDGTSKLINGTFDWAYEEEFGCLDGFRWSPDSKTIAYWQIDASKIKNYLMLNTTDSIYPFTVPVEYPVAGEDPSSAKLAVVNVSTGKTTWMKVPGDAVQHYIPRMEWTTNPNEIILQQLNRAQNESKVFIGNISNGTTHVINEEVSKSWVDVRGSADGWQWIDKGKAFIWASERDGWNHAYKMDHEGKETLLTKGDYDMISISLVDEASGYLYFIASPDNPTQKYLYKVKINGSSTKPERVSPADEPGTHGYQISPNGKIALHSFSNSYTAPVNETISLPDHKHLSGGMVKIDPTAKKKVEFFNVKTVDGVELNGWMVKPTNFDPTKKYPVVFFVYAEPASETVNDTYNTGRNAQYIGNMADDGYIYMAINNRGTPAPKGAAWRKAIYKNIGIINIRDQAMGAKEILKWPFVDSSRVAVHGWSGGGSTTLNLLFQYPEIYKTGIAIAAVGWQLSYDNIYQERYMGVPIDAASREVFVKGSPVTYAKNLRGNLLYMHGTGDDNVHYRNAELLINELIKYNRQFDLMSYPNRTHGISEGEGTSLFLRTKFTKYLKEHCPPGGR